MVEHAIGVYVDDQVWTSINPGSKCSWNSSTVCGKNSLKVDATKTLAPKVNGSNLRAAGIQEQYDNIVDHIKVVVLYKDLLDQHKVILLRGGLSPKAGHVALGAGSRHDLLRFYICQDLFVKDGSNPGNEESILYNSAAVLAARKWAGEDQVQPLATNLYFRDKLSNLAAFLVRYTMLCLLFINICSSSSHLYPEE